LTQSSSFFNSRCKHRPQSSHKCEIKDIAESRTWIEQWRNIPSVIPVISFLQ